MNETLLWVIVFLICAAYPLKLMWTVVSHEDAWGDRFGALLISSFFGCLIFMVTFMVVGLGVMGLAYEDTGRKCSTVVKVGGCDRWGACTVRLKDGTIRELHKPVEGQEDCRFTGSRYKWGSK